MIIEAGHFALLLATCVALVQTVVPLWGLATRNDSLIAVARPAALIQFFLIALAFLALMNAFVSSDFSLAVVVQHSHSAQPLLYKVTGVWGNHEGSMTLWVLILALFGAAVASVRGQLPDGLRARVLAIQGLIGLAFLLFIVFTSNPFERALPPTADGRDLNPLLQDPGLAFHPPFLYLGYVGFSTVFSFAIAALLEGRVDAAWARWVRPWTLAAWCSLTLGIGLGSWWAYYELGWGGWWFWDPVENASFMPWLAGTALLHSAVVVEKRNALKTWTILLAIVAFSLSLIGTFLVRSGVLTSVHSFANDPDRGVFILILLVIAIGGSLVLFAIRAPTFKSGSLFAPVSREGGLVLNNAILSIALATVFLGTLYPLFLEAATGDKVSVGPPYFEATFAPLMVPLLLALPFGPVLPWKRADLLGAAQRLWIAVGLAGIGLIGVSFVNPGGVTLAVGGMGLALWVVFGALAEFASRIKLFRAPFSETLNRARHLPRSAYGMTVAHCGVGILVAGIVAMSAWKSEQVETLRPGDALDIAGYRLVFEGVDDQQGPNYAVQRGRFRILHEAREIGRLEPEKRFYPVQQMGTTEAAIRTGWLADLYIVLGDPRTDGAWTVRAYHNPLAPWLWAGVLIMMLGGLISLSDRRYRVGIPARRRRERQPRDAGTLTGARTGEARS